MNYTTQQLISRLGLTREALRYYEKTGLISPGRLENNQYRTYSDLDGFEILRIKVMQSYQRPIKAVQDQLDCRTLEAQREELLTAEQQLEGQIKRMQAHLLRIKKHRSFVEDAISGLGQVMEMPVTYGIYKLMMLGKDVHCDASAFEIASQWIRSVPMTEIGWTVPWPELPGDAGRQLETQLGLVAMPHCVEENALCIDPPVFFFPTGRSIRTMVRTDDPFHVDASVFAPLSDYAKQHQLSIRSDVSGSYSGCTMENGQRYYYFTARVLVSPKKKA